TFTRSAMMNRRPAVIFPALDDVDLVTAARPIEPTWTVLGLPQEVRARLEIDSLRVAAAVSPNLWPRIRPAQERIVTGHGPIVVQTENFSAQRIQLLRDLSIGRVTGRDVKLAV